MVVDFFLSFVLFLVGVVIVFLFAKVGKKAETVLGGQELKLSLGHILGLVAAMGIMVYVLIFIPDQSLVALLSFAYVMVLFLFTYMFAPKLYLAAVPPALFLFLFFFCWNIYFFDIFAVIFGIGITVYMGTLFTWKTTLAFVSLLTVVDIIQVLITGFTVASAQKALDLGLPVGVILPAVPFDGGYTFLGLGDIFFLGLLAIQSTQKYGKRFGYVCVAVISVVFFVFQTAMLNSSLENFPATVFIISGWAVSLAAKYLYHRFSSKKLV
jgi:presenilin-like A22 family membrane protease